MRDDHTRQLEIPFAEYTLGALVENAVETVRAHAPADGKPYHGCFSGGKDSVVLKEVVRLSGVPVGWFYNVTTIDPPELVRFIKREHPDVTLLRPAKNFFARLPEKGFPTRRVRWCCEEYKESRSPDGARLLLGVRAAESPRRAATWKVCTFHKRTKDYAISPILYWSDDNVWDFIRSRPLPYCCLYDEGFKRLGCIGCPMARKAGRLAEFARWPRYEQMWRKAFQELWNRRTRPGGGKWGMSAKFNNADEMFEWWLSDEPLPGEPEECGGMLDLFS